MSELGWGGASILTCRISQHEGEWISMNDVNGDRSTRTMNVTKRVCVYIGLNGRTECGDQSRASGITV